MAKPKHIIKSARKRDQDLLAQLKRIEELIEQITSRPITIRNKTTADDIIQFIGDDEKTAVEVASIFKLSYPATITRLKNLEAGNKLKARKDGKKKLYSKV